MTDTELVLERLDKMQGQMDRMEGQMNRMEGCMDRMEGQMNRMESRMDCMESRMDHMESRMDHMESRMDCIESHIDCMEQKIESLDTKVDNVEIGLSGQIQKVYEIAQKNAEDIKLLLPYKDKILNVSSTVARIEQLEEQQHVVDGVVASHSEDIRMLKSRLA